MSFFVFGLGNEGVAGATDSATSGNFTGAWRSYLGQKVYELPDANVSIAACGAIELSIANQHCREWPSPLSLVRRNPAFEEVVVAVQKQMASGEIATEPHYDLALFSGSGPIFPRLATIHDGRIKYAAVGDIVFGSYARSAQASWISELAPNNLVALRDLVIAASSRTLRRFGDRTDEGLPVISWPIYVYARSWLDGTTTRRAMETITEVEAKPAEWRYLAGVVAEVKKNPPLHTDFYDQFLGAIESFGPPPEDVAEAIRLFKTAIIRPPTPTSSTTPEAPPTGAASMPSPDPAIETPTEPPSSTTLPA